METFSPRTTTELESGLETILQSPKDGGRLELIARRPAVDQREILETAMLSTAQGVEGDTWNARPSSRTSDRSPHPDMQVTLMNARVIALLATAQEKERWAQAGDQLFVDLDLSAANLPPGTQLSIGSAIIEITAQAHTGCQKFAARFGKEALLFINAPERRDLRLRGVNARVIQPGQIRAGDQLNKVTDTVA